MTKIAKLDKRIIDAIEKPATGQSIVWDAEVKGFGLRITKAGARSFILNYRNKAGIDRRLTIGSYPDWSATAARAEASEHKKAIDRGEDPMAERQDERQAPTFSDLADEYLKNHAFKKRTGKADEQTLGRYILPRLGKLKVRDITHKDIDKFHRDRKNTPIQANREIALLSKMFSLAVKWGYRTDNPAKGIERYPENKRRRYLSTEELSHLLNMMAAHTPPASVTAANLIRLLLLTGARKGEAMSATWDMFDLDKGEWVKPSSHTKQKQEHRAPLSAPALALLVDIKTKAEEAAKADGKDAKPSKFVFPGRGGLPHITEPKKFWDAMRRLASISLWSAKPDTAIGKLVSDLTVDGKLPSYEAVEAAAKTHNVELPAGLLDVHIHDLRHTYASILASSGLSLPIIGQLLGHTQVQTTARYSHLFDDPLRDATNRVGSLLDGMVKGKTAEVIHLHGGRNGGA